MTQYRGTMSCGLPTLAWPWPAGEAVGALTGDISGCRVREVRMLLEDMSMRVMGLVEAR